MSGHHGPQQGPQSGDPPHGPPPPQSEGHGHRRRLTLVFCLAAGYSLVELAGGFYTSSLALLADAFHLLMDVGALALSLFAVWMSERPADLRRTFGHRRAEILAALANGVALAVVALMIAIRAIGRLDETPDVKGLGVVVFASGALLYEIVSLWILSGGRRSNLNVRGAWLHILSDALGSLGAIASGFAIWAAGWYWTDAVASMFISALILYSAWGLIRDAVDILMEAAPSHLDVAEIRAALLELPGACGVHDLHVWTIGSGEISLSAHVVVDPGTGTGTGTGPEKMLERVRELLRDRFAMTHTTVQIEAAEGEHSAVSGDLNGCQGACEAPTR